jgi:CheY-like chemotaxis protein
MSEGSGRGEEAPAPVIVFVVEDEPLIQDLVLHPLEEAGYRVLVASSGAQAIKVIEGNEGKSIRALVTDIDLGRRPPSGWEVARRARELQPEIPVVYMTGDSADDWASQGVPNSVLVTKPFAPAQIVTAVSHLLNATPTVPPPSAT